MWRGSAFTGLKGGGSGELGLLKSKKVRPKPRLPLRHMRSLGRLRFRDVVFCGLEHGGVRKRGGWIRGIKDLSRPGVSNNQA